MKFLLIFLILSLSILSGCMHSSQAAKNTSTNLPAVQANQMLHTHELLAFYETFSEANIDLQKNLLAELGKPLKDSQQNQLRQIKLAMAYGLPSSRVRDPLKAQTILQELIQMNDQPILDSAWVYLFHEWLADTNKLLKAKNDSKLQQQRIDALQQKNEQLQQKYDALEQKLNALKKIEKTMGNRDSAAPKP
jgi:hypothetical protein